MKASRATIKDLTAEELMEIELEKSRLEEAEEHRLQQVSKQDNAHFDNYNKIHNIMLTRR